ncbi:MAG: hypothetical protein GXO79_00140 [Chlorobi bacterium]|nr:hypothetical protein [Chlorobiota bacterium]
MEEFKLIAIRPLRGCDRKLIKVLKEGEIYQFYQDYKFIRHDENDIHSDIKKIEYTSTIPDDLYNLNDININISAVVGKNGSGKSSLFELLFAFCYSIAVKKGIIKDVITLKKLIKKPSIEGNETSNHLFSDNLKDIYSIINNTKVEIYYSINGEIYLIKNENEGYEHFMLEINKWVHEDFNFNNFYYSLVVNYSIYGLNDKDNIWIKSLFHKNDGYQTPIVINPFRNEGNIDVNSEAHLAQSRVLANLTIDKQLSEILEGKIINKLNFNIYPEKLDTIQNVAAKNVFDLFETDHNESVIRFYNKISDKLIGYKLSNQQIVLLENILKDDLSKDLTKHIFKESNTEIKDNVILYLFVKYVINKVYKICYKYPEYNDRFYSVEKEDRPIPQLSKISDLITKLKEDGSHITLKLKQALYTIKEEYFFNIKWNIVKSDINSNKLKYDLSLTMNTFKSKILSGLNNNRNEIKEIIELIPGAFVKPTLLIKYDESKNSESNIQQLSSGELQFIHTLHTVLYHLNNINSVFRTSDNGKIKYSRINIMLDEIELYFHPEFQQRLTYELLRGIGNLDIPKIKGINILFSTHSPFILSDIPSVNILRLKDGVPFLGKANSFGANIHDILADGFFLSDGFIGEFSKIKIKELIAWLNNKDNKNNSEYQKKLIRIIDEPIVQRKLAEMYDNKMETNIQLTVVEEQIKQLEQIKKKLE